MSIDAVLAALADRQHGCIDRAQLLECGLTDRALQLWVRSGRIVRLHGGVFRVGGAPVTFEQRLGAACLAAGPGSVVSHRAAARLWGIVKAEHEVVEITVPRPRSPVPRRTVLHRSTDLAPHHVAHRRQLPITNPMRTLVDLGAVLSRVEVEDALDRALVARLCTQAGVEALRHEAARPGRTGSGVLRRILDNRALGDQRPDGLLEPRMARLLRTAGLPEAEFQFDVRDLLGRFVARVDFAYPEFRLFLEVDG